MFYHKLSQIFNSGIARAVFFIGFTGGLLLFSSIVFANICNLTFIAKLQLPCLNYLESAGIMAFVYIVGFGVKFGITNKDLTNSLMSKFQKSDKNVKTESIVNNLSKMSSEEREILKQQLASCCGMNKKSNQHIPQAELTQK
jgi:hypothetical protein